MIQPQYFPFMHGVYDVKAGLAALSKDLGHGPMDGLVFQIDDQFPAYQQAKQQAAQNPARHILRDGETQRVEQWVSSWISARLRLDYPHRFGPLPGPPSESLDELALQVPEDLAILTLDNRGANRLAYLNVAMPSGWAPEEKIGKPFDAVHAPVPHIEPINAKQDAIARLMVNATRGVVRFAWTITTDPALNHHPLHNPEDARISPTPLPDHPRGKPLLRVERQVVWGFPQQQAALFTIRTYLYPFDSLNGQARSALSAAVGGMSEQSLAYKNMDRALILSQLANGSP